MGSCYSGHRVARCDPRPRAGSTLSIQELEEIRDDTKPCTANTTVISKMKIKSEGEEETSEILGSDQHLTKQQSLVKQLYQQLQENKTQLPFELPDLWSLLGMESDLESGPSNAESQHGTPMTASADSIRDHVGKELRALRIHMARSQAILTVLAKAAYTSQPALSEKFTPPAPGQSKRHVICQQSSNGSNNPYLTDLLPFDVWESSPEHSCRSSSQFSNLIGQKEMLPAGRLPQTKTQSLDHGPSCVRTPVNSRRYRTLSCPILPSQSTLVIKETQTEINNANSKNEENRSGTNQQGLRLQVSQMTASSDCSLSPNMSRHRSHSFLVAVRKGNPLLRDLASVNWSADSTGSSADVEPEETEPQTDSTYGDRNVIAPIGPTSGQHAGPPRKLFSLPEEEQEDPHSPEAFSGFRRAQVAPPPPRPRLPPPYRPPPAPCTGPAALSRSTPLLLSWTPSSDPSSARCGPYSLEDLCHYGRPPSYQAHDTPYADFYRETSLPCCNHRHDATVYAVPVTIAAPPVVEAPPNYRRHCVVPAVVVQNSCALRRSAEQIPVEQSASTGIPQATLIESPPELLPKKTSVDHGNVGLDLQQTCSQNGGAEPGDSHHFRRGSSRRRLGLSGSSSNPLIQRSSAVELDETDHPSKLSTPDPVDLHSRPLLTSRSRVSKPPRRMSSTGQVLLDVESSETESAKNSGGSMESEPEHPVAQPSTPPTPLPPLPPSPHPVDNVDQDVNDTPRPPSPAAASGAQPEVAVNEMAGSDGSLMEEQPLGDGPSPSLTDSFLGKLKLLRSKMSGQQPMTEKEVESKFHRLTLAIKTDKFTMSKRLELNRRQRDLAESSVEKDLKGVKEKIDVMTRSCGDHDVRFQLTQLQQQVNTVKQSAAKMSSRAEVYGAVQQEDRLCQTVDIMMLHVENIKRQHDKLQAELDLARQFLRENNITSPRGPNASATHKSSFANQPHPNVMSRRRASVASIPRFLIKGQSYGQPELGQQVIQDSISASEAIINKRRPSICCLTHPFSSSSPLIITNIKERSKDSTVLKLNHRNATNLQDVKEVENETSSMAKGPPTDVPSPDGHSSQSLMSTDVSDQLLELRVECWPPLHDDDVWDDEDEEDDLSIGGRGESRTPAFDTSPYHMDRWMDDGRSELPDDLEQSCHTEMTTVKTFSWPKSSSPILELWYTWCYETDTVVQIRWAVGVALVIAALCCLVSAFLPRGQASCSLRY